MPFVVFPASAVTSDFLTAADNWEVTRPITDPTIFANRSSSMYALHENARNFTRLDNLQCMERYIDPLQATSDLVLVSNVTTAQNNGSSLIFAWMSGSDSMNWNGATNWICSSHENAYYTSYCSIDKAQHYADDWVVLGPSMNATIYYCLVGEQGDNGNRCGFHFSAYIMATVCLLTSIETILISWTTFKHRTPTIVTVGDAIAEFLKDPDESTGGSSTLVPVVPKHSKGQTIARLGVTFWNGEHRIYWFKAVSLNAWLISTSL